MKTPDPLKPPLPAVTGFHKRNIAAFVAIAVVVVAAAIYILTAGDDSRIVRTEPRIPRRPELPPAALLEEPPPPPAPPELPLWRPPEPAGPPPLPPEPPPPAAWVTQGLQSAMASAAASARNQRSTSGSLAGTTEFLETALRDLERQQERLAELQGGFRPLPPGRPVAPPTPRGEAVRFTQNAPARRVDQGTLVEAQLLTAIDSHLPGQILAQVTHDVFDSATLRTVLVPKGSRLLGRYDQNLALGQNRILVAWDRILFPDGSSLEMPGQPGVDPQGRSGLRDRVNHHVGRIFGHAALLSLIGAGFELAQPAEASDRARLAVTGASRELELAAAELLRSRSAIPPTIKIRPGVRFHVLLNRDLTFDAL